MNNKMRKYIINELMVEDFIEWSDDTIHLEEAEDTGKSKLVFALKSDGNLTIKNVDKKKTEILFFEKSSKKSMFKRVDHIIFEHIKDEQWKLHLIEMKSAIFDKKWRDVKGKFRASYLVAKAIAAILDINIVDICLYTTYENVHFQVSETMPSERRLYTGKYQIKPIDEWKSGKVRLNLGTDIILSHVPVQMGRDELDVLVGECCGY